MRQLDAADEQRLDAGRAHERTQVNLKLVVDSAGGRSAFVRAAGCALVRQELPRPLRLRRAPSVHGDVPPRLCTCASGNGSDRWERGVVIEHVLGSWTGALSIATHNVPRGPVPDEAFELMIAPNVGRRLTRWFFAAFFRIAASVGVPITALHASSSGSRGECRPRTEVHQLARREHAIDRLDVAAAVEDDPGHDVRRVARQFPRIEHLEGGKPVECADA